MLDFGNMHDIVRRHFSRLVHFSTQSSPLLVLLISHYSDSNSNCTRGFPDIPVSEVGRRTTTNMTTLLIPEMNFTCNAKIIGFTVAGRSLSPYSHIQIWRKKNSSMYYKVEDFSVHGDVCVAMQTRVGNTFLCILQDNFQVSVQPGDILGLELPATDSDEILFTNGGPTNYIFNHWSQMDYNINLSLSNGSSTAQQLPQIIFNLTSGKLCAYNKNIIFNCAHNSRECFYY